VRGPCDAVIIATPPRLHASMLEACIEAGKPCIVEKPLCLDVRTAERLERRVRASRLPVLVDHVHLFHPAYEALKDTLARTGQAIRRIVSEGLGWGTFRPETSALWDWGPHDLSLSLDLMGRMPVSLSALGGPRSPQGEPELFSVRLDFRGGACAWIQAGRLSARKRRLLSVVTDTRCYVVDEWARQPLTVSPIDFPRRYRGRTRPLLSPQPIRVGTRALPLSQMLRYFVDGLRGGERSRFGLGLGVQVVRLLARCDDALASRF
jgi:predicted dehydrogenase